MNNTTYIKGDTYSASGPVTNQASAVSSCGKEKEKSVCGIDYTHSDYGNLQKFLKRRMYSEVTREPLYQNVFSPQSGTSKEVESTINVPLSKEQEDFNIVTFVDDDDKNIRNESYVATISKQITSLFDSMSIENDIKDYLKRPVVVTSGNFSTSDTYSTLSSFAMPYAVANSGATSKVFYDKLKGFFGMRMNMRFKLVVNANPFQQGRYIVGWVPTGGSRATTSNLKELNWVNMHMATLVQRTTIMHTEIDISTTTTCELLVPFMSCNSFYPINALISATNTYNLGYINVYPYYALQAPTGSTIASYTLYVSFEDVQLIGAASPQAGDIKHPDETAINRGVVSGPAGSISRLATFIAKENDNIYNFPVLSDVATTASWVMEQASNVAAFFGFSKPNVSDVAQRMQLQTAPCHPSVDGVSDARPMSYLSRPGTSPLEGLGGTKLDEMDFSYIAGKFAWFSTVTFSTSNVVGDVLTTIDVSPSKYVTTTQTRATCVSYPPVGFLITFFRFWRGSLKFKFKVVKTNFHSGRISVAFFPTDEIVSYTGDDTFASKIIIDLRQHNEFEIIVPYISRMPWMPLNTSDTPRTGVLKIAVVDPLIAPSSVSSNIYFLCEIAGGDDFRVAVPGNYNQQPTFFAPQSGDSKDTQTIYSHTLGMTTVKDSHNLFNSLTIGDSVTSFRSLTRRFSGWISNNATTTTTFDNPGITFPPDIIMASTPVAASAPTTSIEVLADQLSLIACCYVFSTGGIVYRDILNTTMSNGTLNTEAGFITASLEEPLATADAIGASQNKVPLASGHFVYQQKLNNNTLTLEIPQYTLTMCRSHVDCLALQSQTMTSALSYVNSGRSPTQGQITIRTSSNLTITPGGYFTYHNLFRAGADDYNCYGFVSVPPVFGVVPGAQALLPA